MSLDQAINTMRQTGAGMKTKDRETSRGRLAVNVFDVLRERVPTDGVDSA
ncbi:hypothetical protein LG284_11425 [Citricoccus nitrophenolicus]